MKSVFFSVVIVIVLFIFLFPRNLPQELAVSPQWEQELSPVARGEAQTGEDGAVIPVRIGERFGYVDGNSGAVLYADTAYYGVTLSSSSFINYSSVNQNLVVRNTRGQISYSFDSRGYPYYVNDALYVLLTDRTGLSKIDAEGRELWSRTFSTVVTDVDSALEQTLVGLLDGRVILVDADGDIAFEQKLSGSTFDGIYGCALSPDATAIGAVSGLSPQRIVYLKQLGDSYAIVVDEELSAATRGYVHATFSSDGSLLFVAQENHIVAVEERTGNLHLLPIKGHVTSIAAPEDGSVNVTSVDDADAWYTRFASVNTPLLSVKVSNGVPFMRVAEGDLWIGVGSRLSKYSLEEK